VGASGSFSTVLRRVILTAEPHKSLKLSGGARHGVVDDNVVELVRRLHLGTSCRQAPFLLLRVLGATTCEPADELIPARRREEDEAAVRRCAAVLDAAIVAVRDEEVADEW